MTMHAYKNLNTYVEASEINRFQGSSTKYRLFFRRPKNRRNKTEVYLRIIHRNSTLLFEIILIAMIWTTLHHQ